jgi:hypothetical protein
MQSPVQTSRQVNWPSRCHRSSLRFDIVRITYFYMSKVSNSPSQLIRFHSCSV